MRTTRVLASIIVCMIATTGLSQEFRVESDVFRKGERKPIAEHLTLFTPGVIYDFAMSAPNEIVLLDAEGRFTLLDVTRKVQAEVTTQQLLQFTTQIRQLLKGRDGLLSPDFDAEFDAAAGTLQLKNDGITYVAQGRRPEQADAVTRYRDFADWYARLNSVRPGNLPPFGRLRLNRELAENGLLPKSITRTVLVDELSGERQHLRSDHTISWELTNSDRRRIQDAEGYRVAFPKVSVKNYLRIKQAVAALLGNPQR